MPRFLDWVRKEPHKSVLDCSIDHLQKVKETVKELRNALDLTGDKTKLWEVLHSVAQKEHEADAIRKKLTFDIAKGELVFTGREHLIEFVQEVDSVADYAHAAGRYLAIFDGEMDDALRRPLIKLADIACESTELLFEAVRNFGKVSKDDTLNLCIQIETLEEKGDDLKRELLLQVFGASYTTAHMITLRDLVEMVENICDQCKLVAGRIRVFTVKIVR
jgi:predicted phosphate transport protein (TIGR00153 family)